MAAAIEILDQIAAGTSAEAALTRWARASRFAGSKDRAAIRDHVFDVLRHWHSDAALGGGETGRTRMIGRALGIDLDGIFNGIGQGKWQQQARRNCKGMLRQPRCQKSKVGFVPLPTSWSYAL